MCVLAGYIGDRPAAPILLEMLRREEGFAGGFYTGIATVQEGKLYHEKVVGDAATLIRETQAQQLPGTIGVVHGRSPSGGGPQFAHPFLTEHHDMAYIANGAHNQYEERVDEAALGSELLRQGHVFSSACDDPGEYLSIRLSDGSFVHDCDIMCHAIQADFDELEESPYRLRDAMMQAYQSYPGEYVGLTLHANRPDEIAVARHNMPLEIGRDNQGGIYLASTTIAFPEEVRWSMRMPPLSGAVIQRDGAIHIAPFTEASLLPMGAALSPDAINQQLCNLLRQRGAADVPELLTEMKKMWPAGVLGEKEIVTYEALAALRNEGLVKLETRRIQGVKEGTTAPRCWVHWCEAESSDRSMMVQSKITEDRRFIDDCKSTFTEAVSTCGGAPGI